MKLLARTLRYLADRLADPDRAERHQANQNTARTNAADASAALRKRRHAREDVDAYLRARRVSHPAGDTGTPRDGHTTPSLSLEASPVHSMRRTS